MARIVTYQDIGLTPYQEAWEYQLKYFDKAVKQKIENRKNNTDNPIQNHLIFCEHPHVYTLGKSGDKNNLLVNTLKLKEISAEFINTSRGGDITYHGPGQIVGYPILDLEQFSTDIGLYLRNIEEAVIQTLLTFDIKATRIKGLTGVWINGQIPRKICAIGVKTSRWVTMHGFALNVNTDLSYFDNIIPCGIDDKNVTSIQKEKNLKIDVEGVKQVLKEKLSKVFLFDIIE